LAVVSAVDCQFFPSWSTVRFFFAFFEGQRGVFFRSFSCSRGEPFSEKSFYFCCDRPCFVSVFPSSVRLFVLRIALLYGLPRTPLACVWAFDTPKIHIAFMSKGVGKLPPFCFFCPQRWFRLFVTPFVSQLFFFFCSVRLSEIFQTLLPALLTTPCSPV